MLNDIVFESGRLRSWEVPDAHRLVQAWTDVQIAEWNAVPLDPTLAVAERWIGGQQERFDNRLSVDLVIDTDHADGILGEVGLSGFSDQHRGALIGYWLLPEARGTGLATAAIQAFVGWAHRTLELDVIVARCHQSNLASQATAQRSGFVYEATDSSQYQLWRSHTRGN